VSVLARITSSGVPDPAFPQPSAAVVEECLNQPTTYALEYAVQPGDGDFPLLSEPRLGPDRDVTVQVQAGNRFETLVRGPVLQQQLSMTVGGSSSTMRVLGADLSVRMNREGKTRVWSDTTDSAVVQAIVGGGDYQFVPQVDATSGVHAEASHVLAQRETDLRFVRRLARRNGYWFWLRTDPSGQLTTAHFKRPPADAPSSATLSLVAGRATAEQVSIDWDVDRPSAVRARQLDLRSLSLNDGSVERSSVPLLGARGLADVVSAPRTALFAAPSNDQADLRARAESLLAESGWFVRARLTTRASLLGTVVRAHSVVTLDGVGARHSGRYLVSRVVHELNETEHHMTIELIRNGWN
jgi:phage protein D